MSFHFRRRGILKLRKEHTLQEIRPKIVEYFAMAQDTSNGYCSRTMQVLMDLETTTERKKISYFGVEIYL